MHEYIDTISDNPIIAAVHNKEGLEEAIAHGVPTIFLLNTDIFSAKAFVDLARTSDRNVFLHMDLIDGLVPGAKALDYVQKRIHPSGIISTKSSLVKHARERGVFCIQRFFMVDNASFDLSVKTVRKTKPSMVELMPGIIPGVIRRFTSEISVPVIAGGMVADRKSILRINCYVTRRRERSFMFNNCNRSIRTIVMNNVSYHDFFVNIRLTVI